MPFVTIGGIRQWISVRGRHKDAPILLFVHGGPGFTSIPSSWFAMQGWDEYFTIAQWDQRGAGKTYAANTEAQMSPGMTVAGMTDDAAQLVQYLRKHYDKQKIFLLGHSWGTVLGTRLAQQHPDWFYAFVPGELASGRDPTASAAYLRATLYDAPKDGRSGLSFLASFLFTHNAAIAISAFALGFALCLPTAGLMLSTGCMLGAFLALFAAHGLGIEAGGWLMIHGVTELFAITLAVNMVARFVVSRRKEFP